jgi:hypothetical protein
VDCSAASPIVPVSGLAVPPYRQRQVGGRIVGPGPSTPLLIVYTSTPVNIGHDRIIIKSFDSVYIIFLRSLRHQGLGLWPGERGNAAMGGQGAGVTSAWGLDDLYICCGHMERSRRTGRQSSRDRWRTFVLEAARGLNAYMGRTLGLGTGCGHVVLPGWDGLRAVRRRCFGAYLRRGRGAGSLCGHGAAGAPHISSSYSVELVGTARRHSLMLPISRVRCDHRFSA